MYIRHSMRDYCKEPGDFKNDPDDLLARLARLRDEKAAAEERARRAEQEKGTCAARLGELERKAEEVESSRKGFLSLLSQLSEARKLAAEGREAAQRMGAAKEEAETRARLISLERETYLSRLRSLENTAEETENARKLFQSLVEELSEGGGAREALQRLMEAKNSLENKNRILELEKEVSASRLRDWERKAGDLEAMQKDVEERETRLRLSEKRFTEKCAALEQRALALESEYARKRRELDEFKARLRAEVNDLTGKEKDVLP